MALVHNSRFNRVVQFCCFHILGFIQRKIQKSNLKTDGRDDPQSPFLVQHYIDIQLPFLTILLHKSSCSVGPTHSLFKDPLFTSGDSPQTTEEIKQIIFNQRPSVQIHARVGFYQPGLNQGGSGPGLSGGEGGRLASLPHL